MLVEFQGDLDIALGNYRDRRMCVDRLADKDRCTRGDDYVRMLVDLLADCHRGGRIQYGAVRGVDFVNLLSDRDRSV